MYRVEDIEVLHLEVTTKCNARCPMCMRNVFGGRTNPQLPLVEITREQARRMFAPAFIAQLKRMYMCGNYGDPIAATDTLQIFADFRECNPSLALEMFTNGSARPPSWWRDLAELGVSVRFGLDGLADTNAIYRRGTQWELIQRNAKAFIAAGGQADWDYIVFKHNEHQIEDARALAQRMGFRHFRVKKTGRFFSNSKVSTKESQEVHDRDGRIEYHLELPVHPGHRNSALAREGEIVERFGSLENFLAITPIECRVVRERSLFVTAEGLVFPCCWTANQLYPWYHRERGAPIWKLLAQLRHGLSEINCQIQPLGEILKGPLFQKLLPESWEKQGFDQGRLFVCGKTCGRGFDPFAAQFEGNSC